MRYAMTGATGFVGLELARQLRNQGHDVVALVRDPAKARPLTELGVELVTGDLDDVAALDRLLAGVDGFFHVAGWYKHGRRERDTLQAVNVEGTRNALAAAKRAGVPRTVYTSTVAVNSDTRGTLRDEAYRHDGGHHAEYDRTKAVAHELAEEAARGGLPLVIVQPGGIYGPNDTSTLGTVTRKIARGRFVLGPRGGGICWAHVEDVARGHVLAMEKGRLGESYMLAGPAATYEDAFALLARLAGTRRPLLVPRPLVRAAAVLTGLLERFLPLRQDQTREAMRSATATYYADSAKAERELGWSTRSLENGFRDTLPSLR